MHYTQHIDTALEARIGTHGAAGPVYEHYLKKAVFHAHAIDAEINAGQLPIFSLTRETGDLADIRNATKRLQNVSDQLLVLGTGGSSLGGKTLTDLMHNPCTPQRVLFVDNVDPHTITQLQQQIDFKRTSVLAISKSGTTVETLSQLLVMMEAAVKQAGSTVLRERFAVITMPGERPLRAIAQDNGMAVIDHDPKVGGRFSVFSPVGLVPAYFAGLDIAALRAGAASVLEGMSVANALPSQGAALHMALMEKGKNVAVLMPYCDRLSSLCFWYRQTWAESTGKDGKGTTPVRALGAVDQHSQLQLYLAGPRDKFITLLMLENKGVGSPIAVDAGRYPALSYLKGRTVGDVIGAEQRATSETLVKGGCPVRQMMVPTLHEKSLGALLMHFMLETVLTAKLLEVNPFDQPAVEESKVLAREYLTKG